MKILLAVLSGGLVVSGLALAASAGPAHRPAAAPTVLAVPPAVPGVVLGGLRAERLADCSSTCDVPRCAPGDDFCRQLSFEVALECVQDGRLGAVDPPGAATTVFRAQGGGFTLYGALGPAGGGHEALLRGVSEAVER